MKTYKDLAMKDSVTFHACSAHTRPSSSFKVLEMCKQLTVTLPDCPVHVNFCAPSGFAPSVASPAEIAGALAKSEDQQTPSYRDVDFFFCCKWI